MNRIGRSSARSAPNFLLPVYSVYCTSLSPSLLFPSLLCVHPGSCTALKRGKHTGAPPPPARIKPRANVTGEKGKDKSGITYTRNGRGAKRHIEKGSKNRTAGSGFQGGPQGPPSSRQGASDPERSEGDNLLPTQSVNFGTNLLLP